MAIGDLYATLAELKSRVGISDTDDDSKLTSALTAASRALEKWCKRQFNDAGSATARVYYPLDPRLVVVDDFHTVTGLIVAHDTDDNGTFDETWLTGDYQLEPLNGIRDGVDGWPYQRIRAVEALTFYSGRRPSVQVTARWGWAAVPAPVKEATLMLAEEIFKMKDAPFGVAGFGDFGFVRVRDNPKVATLVKDYRRIAVRVR